MIVFWKVTKFAARETLLLSRVSGLIEIESMLSKNSNTDVYLG